MLEEEDVISWLYAPAAVPATAMSPLLYGLSFYSCLPYHEDSPYTTVSLTVWTLPLQCLPHHDDSPSIIVNQNKLYQSLLVMVITATNTRGCFTSKLQHPA